MKSRRLACIATLLLVPGCASLRPGEPAPPDVLPPAVEQAPNADLMRFAMPGVTMLYTWNAVGQVLVRLDGVSYQGRSQMLGLYDERYRGEHLLIVTRARVMRTSGDGMLTEVGALQHDGKPSDSAAAAELLRLLQQRLPAELARIAAGER